MPERAAPARGVLITRPEPGASETAARVAALGFAPIVAPVLSVRALDAVLPDSRRFQALLVASGRAVDALPASHLGLPLLAVGDATAERARRAGHVAVHSAAGDAEALAALAGRLCDPAGAPLLLATGSGQGAALEAALRGRGFRVERHFVYGLAAVAALPADARRALAERRVAHALFFSAETARVLARLVQDGHLTDALRPIDALAISAKVAAALARLPWRSVSVAANPNQDDMMALLA